MLKLKPGDIVRLKVDGGWSPGLISRYGHGPHQVACRGNHYGVFLNTMKGTVITYKSGSGPNHEVNFHESCLELDRFMTAVAQRKLRKESGVQVR